MQESVRKKEVESENITKNETASNFYYEMERTLSSLASQLYDYEDYAEIGIQILIKACEFHEADWAGIILMDKGTGIWEPYWWYDVAGGAMAETRIHPFEYIEGYDHWIGKLKTGEAIVIPNVEETKKECPIEYNNYVRLDVKSLIGVPFGSRPSGFLVVRNPKRYPMRSSFLQVLSCFIHSTVKDYWMSQEIRHMMKPHTVQSNRELIINLFGELQIVSFEGSICESELKASQGWEILAYLMLHRNRHVSSAELARQCWENDEPRAPGAAVRNTIYRFNQACSYQQIDTLISSGPSGYCINPAYTIHSDIDQIEALLKQSRAVDPLADKIELLVKAFDLYKGDLFASKDATWLTEYISYYEHIYTDIVNALLEALEQKKEYRKVEYYAARAMSVKLLLPTSYYWLAHAMYYNHNYEKARAVLEKAERMLTPEDHRMILARIEKELPHLRYNAG